MSRGRDVVVAVSIGLVLFTSACGDDGGVAATASGASEAVTPAEPAPTTPTEMCDGGEAPALAAYARTDGAFRWAVCSPDAIRHSVVGATDEAVYLEGAAQPPSEQTLIAYDPRDGTELEDGGPPGDRPEPLPVFTGDPSVFYPVIDGIRIEGGQSDPTRAVDVATGEELWSRPGSLVYDDVFPVGDGAIYAIETDDAARSRRMVAYELETGDVRWQREGIDPYGAEIGWPWYVDDGVLFTIWSNLALLSTDDGSTIWRTDYPPDNPMTMTGVRSNADSVFVSFSSVPSPGD